MTSPVPPRACGLAAARGTLDTVDEEARRIVSRCYDEACSKPVSHRPRLDALVDALMEHETLDRDEAYRVAGTGRADGGG